MFLLIASYRERPKATTCTGTLVLLLSGYKDYLVMS